MEILAEQLNIIDIYTKANLIKKKIEKGLEQLNQQTIDNRIDTMPGWILEYIKNERISN